MKKIGFLIAGLLLASCTGNSGPSNREACEGIAEAALDMAVRCDRLDPFASGDDLTPAQYLAAVEGFCCVTDDCVGPEDASSSDIESCEAAILFQDCATGDGFGFPDSCQGIGALGSPPPPP